MADTSYTRAEMETTIRFDAEEKTAHIYSADPVYIRKLDKLTETNPESYKCVRILDGGKAKMYEAPANLIRFGKPLSESQIEQRRQTARKAYENSGLYRRTSAEKTAPDAMDE